MNINDIPMIIETKDNKKILGFLSKNNKNVSSTVVVHVNGRSASQFGKMATQMRNIYNDNGIDFFSYDFRYRNPQNHTCTDEDVARYTSSDAFLDLEAAIDCVKQQGYENILLEGHSLGTEIVTYFLLNKVESSVSQLILLSPCDHIEAVENSSQFLSIKELNRTFEEAARCVMSGQNDKIILNKGKGNLYSTVSFLETFSYLGNFNHFNFNESIFYNSLSIPVTIFLGTKDPTLPNIEKATKYFKNAFPISNVIVLQSGHNLEVETLNEKIQESILKYEINKQIHF